MDIKTLKKTLETLYGKLEQASWDLHSAVCNRNGVNHHYKIDLLINHISRIEKEIISIEGQINNG